LNILIAALSLSLLQEQSQAVMLEVGKIAEPCLKLAAGERLEFSFSAAAPLDFNIHYHTSDNRVYFPVQGKSISSREGVYIAPATRDYCLMWTNNTAGKPTRLE